MSARQVVFIGVMYDPNLQVGGGPMPGGPGGPPLGIWGPIGNYPDAGFPGPQPGGPTHIWGGPWQPPRPSQGPGFPTNPIAEPPWGFGNRPPQPPKPPVIWGGGGVGDYIDAGGPGPQPGGPIYIWGPIGDYIDAGFPAPQPPLPPTLGEPARPVEWKVGWTAATGWIVVGIPTGPTVTPSKG